MAKVTDIVIDGTEKRPRLFSEMTSWERRLFGFGMYIVAAVMAFFRPDSTNRGMCKLLGERIGEQAAPRQMGESGDMYVLLQQNKALGRFIRFLGFDSEKIARELCDSTNATCKDISLAALRVHRDFTKSFSTTAGIAAANNWLDSLQFSEPEERQAAEALAAAAITKAKK